MKVHTNQSEPGELEIVFARTTHGGGGYTMHLQVLESSSRTTLVDVQLNAEQYMQLMSASHITVQGTPIQCPEHIGKVMQNAAISFKEEKKARRSGIKALASGRWEDAEVRRQNFGWTLYLTRWVKS